MGAPTGAQVAIPGRTPWRPAPNRPGPGPVASPETGPAPLEGIHDVPLVRQTKADNGIGAYPILRMPRQTIARVDRANLQLVLDAIAQDAQCRAEFLREGHPENGVFMQGVNRIADLRLHELRSCVEQEPGWRVNNTTVGRHLQQAAYRYLEHGMSIAEVASLIETELSIELRLDRYIVEVTGLEAFVEPLVLGPFTFGRVDQLANEAGLSIDRRLWGGNDPEPAMTMGVLFDVEASGNDSQNSRKTLREAERGLNVLAGGHLRHMFLTGAPWSLRVGRWYWRWREGKRRTAAGMADPWMHGTPYGVDKAALKATSLPRRRAPLDAWASLPAGDLRDSLEAASQRLGLAVRLMPTPTASLPTAWTAMEVAFAPRKYARREEQGDRAARAIATRMKLCVAKEGTIEDPAMVASFYSLRGEILHDGVDWFWDMSDGDKRLRTIHGHLDELADYCRTTNISTWAALLQRLNAAEVRQRTRSWAQRYLENSNWISQNSVLPETREGADRVRKLWSKVLKQI